MYKLMLVDDVSLICEGLQELINWSNYGVEIVYVAKNGEEALNFLYDNELDIMITDIRMPGMSGIELLHAAKRCQPQLQCLVLSGYDDYELVRNAMRAGALDYLLKPVNPGELEQSVSIIISNLDQHKIILPASAEEALLEQTFRRMILNDISPKERMEKLEFFQIDPNPKCVSVGLVRYEDLSQVRSCVEKSCKGTFFTPFVFNAEGDIQCIIYYSDRVLFDAKEVRYVMQRCTNALHNLSSGQIFSATSSVGQGWRQIPRLYEQASFSLDYTNMRYPMQDTAFLDYSAISIISVDITRLRLLLLSGTSKEIYQYIDELFRAYSITETGPIADNLSLSILRSALSICMEMILSSNMLEDIRSKALKDIAKAGTLRILQTRLTSALTELTQAVLTAPKDSYSNYINQLLEIVAEEYPNSALGLCTIADRLFVNATYLGRQFKIETGSYFNDYLARLRIRQAEMLLMNTDLPIAKVAMSVGFSSVNYFCQVFKKITSVTPSEIREASNIT